jgi:hypothetical protein
MRVEDEDPHADASISAHADRPTPSADEAAGDAKRPACTNPLS